MIGDFVASNMAEGEGRAHFMIRNLSHCLGQNVYLSPSFSSVKLVLFFCLLIQVAFFFNFPLKTRGGSAQIQLC